MSTTEKIRTQMRAFGLDYAGPILADHRLHRFRANGDKSRNSWYVFHAGPPVAGAFGCWKRSVNENFCDRNGSLTQADWDQIRARWLEAEKAREQAETERRDKARKTAAWIMQRASPAEVSNAYLAKKCVQPHGELRQWRGLLVVPLRDAAGQLHSLQFIGDDGTKRFLTGGRIAGCFFTLAEKSNGPLVIAEGYATAASIVEATGLSVVSAMNCTNLAAVATAMRTKWPKREFIIAADNDAFTKDADGKPWNPGVEAGREVALAVGAKLAVPHFADVSTNPSDFNDLAKLKELNEVKTQIETAETPAETIAELVARLAKLTPLDFDRVCKAEAKRLGVKASTLEKEVTAIRANVREGAAADWMTDILPQAEPTPWADPVNGAELLDTLAATLNHFAVFTPHAADALALFILTTYGAELFDAAPYVHLSSPTKRCGKSLVNRLLAKLCARALPAGPCSESALFRAIAAVTPTLLIDETDTFFAEHPELRGILNAGNVRDDASILRTEETVSGGKKEFAVRRFSVFCPKVFVGIGRLGGKESRLWDTLADRCITIPMQRKRPDEKRVRFRRRRFDPEPLRQQCRRWVDDHSEALAGSEPSLPEELNDRAADLWEPLLAVADLAGGHWPDKARAAAAWFSGESETGESASDGTQLLADIATIFREIGRDRIFSDELCKHLNAMEERPYGDSRKGNGLNPNRLARELAPFGVSTRKIRLPGQPKPRQGYLAETFANAWQRYVPTLVPCVAKWNIGTKPVNTQDSSLFEVEQEAACSTLENAVLTNNNGPCSVVPVPKAQERGKTKQQQKLDLEPMLI